MNIVLTGGGSAGHTVPHLAILPQLKYKFDNISYIGTDGIEKSIIERQSLPFYTIKCAKLVRKAPLKNIKLPAVLIKSVSDSKKILKKLRPDVVFSKGGYVALPVAIAAHSLGIPVIAHESDLSAGLANRLSSRYCKTVLTSFEETAKDIKNGKYCGSPIREELFAASREGALKEFGFGGDKKIVLVLGGGSGSVAINDCLREGLDILLKTFDILHICGKGNLAPDMREGYVQREYIDNMALAFACVDIVVSRAGSNSMFEIILLKKPSLIIPLPKKASRGDQIENALYFENKGLCKVLMQEDLNVKSLTDKLNELKNDRNLMLNLKSNKLKCGNADIVNALCLAAKRG